MSAPPTSAPTPHVAVLGGGPAGLAAAHRLLAAGWRVTLFEAGGATGGLLRSDTLDGVLLDPAVQLVADSYTRLFALAEATGARGLLTRSPGRDALWRDGRIHPITYGSIASMTASGALPLGLKLRLGARYLPFLTRRAAGLDASDPARSGGLTHDHVSVAAWAGEHMGEDFAELLAYPLLGAYYGATPEETSAAFYHGLAREGLDVRVHGARGGMGALAAAITAGLEARGLTVRTGTQVRYVRPDGTGILVGVATGESGAATSGSPAAAPAGQGAVEAGEGIRFDAAVLAVPAPEAARLLDAGGALGAWLAAIRTRPTASVALLLERAPGVDWFGLSFPRRSGPGAALVAATVQGNKAGGTGHPVGGGADDRRDVLLLLPAPDRAEALATAEPNAAVEALLGPLEEALPGVRRRVLRARHYPFPHGYTLYPPGHTAHMAAFDEAWLPRGVALAGGFRVSPTVEGAVRSGERAADRLLAG